MLHGPPSLPKLEPLLHSSASLEQKSTLLKIIKFILNLDASHALKPNANPSFKFLIEAFKHLLSGKGASVQEQQLLSQALGLLGTVLVALQQQQQQQQQGGEGGMVAAAVDDIEAALHEIAVNQWGTNTNIDR